MLVSLVASGAIKSQNVDAIKCLCLHQQLKLIALLETENIQEGQKKPKMQGRVYAITQQDVQAANTMMNIS